MYSHAYQIVRAVTAQIVVRLSPLMHVCLYGNNRHNVIDWHMLAVLIEQKVSVQANGILLMTWLGYTGIKIADFDWLRF